MDKGRISPCFEVGDTIKYFGPRQQLTSINYTIKEVKEDHYVATDGTLIPFKFQEYYKIVDKELEEEIGFDVFVRSNRGIVITPEGEEFMSYARQVLDQYNLLQDRFINKTVRQKFGVSTQHYSFAVKAFVEVVNEYGLDNYEFAIHESRTEEVIENVKFFKSEVGVLYEKYSLI